MHSSEGGEDASPSRPLSTPVSGPVDEHHTDRHLALSLNGRSWLKAAKPGLKYCGLRMATVPYSMGSSQSSVPLVRSAEAPFSFTKKDGEIPFCFVQTAPKLRS